MSLPELLRHWFYALCLSLTLGALWDFWCCVAVAAAGIPVSEKKCVHGLASPWMQGSRRGAVQHHPKLHCTLATGSQPNTQHLTVTPAPSTQLGDWRPPQHHHHTTQHPHTHIQGCALL
jgi:hypothetical protein